MFLKRATSILMLIGIAVSLAFILQVVVSQAEHSGLYKHDFSQTAKKLADKLARVPSQMCHATCCSPLPVATHNEISVEKNILCMRAVFPVDELVPDGPVLSVDHPPQLS